MNCPVCKNSELRMTERQGIEIDYCPQCRGVWLDRGELDKIIERAAKERLDEPALDRPPESSTQIQRDEDRRRRDSDRYYREEKRRYKRKSFWSELFDFD